MLCYQVQVVFMRHSEEEMEEIILQIYKLQVAWNFVNASISINFLDPFIIYK